MAAMGVLPKPPSVLQALWPDESAAPMAPDGNGNRATNLGRISRVFRGLNVWNLTPVLPESL